MSNLLIGGTGFIGSALGEALTATDEPVISLSRSKTGTTGAIQQIALNLDTQLLPDSLIENNPDVYLLTGQTGPAFNAANELASLKQLVQTLARRSGHIFFFSTALVYGNCTEPARETTLPNPIGSYPTYKLAAEQLLTTALPTEQLTILRLSNVYGSPKNRGFINLVLRSILEPLQPLTLLNNGDTIRDYIFLDDLIRVLMAIKNHPARHGIINLVSGTSYSLNDVVSATEQIAGRRLVITRSDERTAEAQAIRTTNQLLSDRFNVSLFTTLTDGLRQTLKRYQEEQR